MTDLAALPPLLLPRPRSIARLDGHLEVPTPLRVDGVDPEALALATGIIDKVHPCRAAGSEPFMLLCSLHGSFADRGHPEAYSLSIEPGVPGVIRLSANTTIGLRHGLHTLAQLLTQYGSRLPGLAIEDVPTFATRGVMLDISRDRVPTMAHLFATVDQLASWKINHLQLYTEHAFAYVGHDEVWRNASPMTAEEYRQLDAHCRARGIELAANQNCFGHLERWLNLPRYAPLAEIAPGQTWDFGGIVTKSGPFSLCPTDPRSLALVEDLLGQLLPNVTSGLVNIGCDEAFDVGQGRSKDEVARRGRAAVYLEFVTKVCAVARRHGKRPQFWADIALEHPEALAELPDDLIGLAWGYEPDAPFARWCDQLRGAGREVWVCPGTSCWRSITGRTTERRGNLLAAAHDGAAHGASGWLATAWGDLGHRQQWPITLHALAEAAHRAWSGTAEYDPRASSLHAFGDRSLVVGGHLDLFGNLDLPLRQIAGKPSPQGSPQPLRNASALFTDLGKPLAENWVGDQIAWRNLNLAGEVFEEVFAVLPLRDQYRSELVHSAKIAALAARRGMMRRRGHQRDGERTRLAQTVRNLCDEHRALWLARCRPGGLDDSCAHYQRLIDELEPA